MSRYPTDDPVVITTEFGVQDPNAYFGYHSGIDLAVGEGTPVHAPAKGSIWWAGWSDTGGNMIILFDGNYYHRLMHNSKLLISKRDQVKEGDLLAYSGSTGLAFGPHVHWDIAMEMLDVLRPSNFNKFINPISWLGDTKEAIMASQDKVDETTIRLEYNSALFRDASRDEVNSWLNSNVTVEQFQRAILQSDEYAMIRAQWAANGKNTVNRDSVLRYVQDNLK